MKSSNDNQSPYAALQAILPRLGLASPRRENRPAFATREEAEKYLIFLKNNDEDAVLRPIWGIDHDALNESEIVAWSIAPSLD